VASDVGGRVAARLTKVARELNGAAKPSVNKAALVLKKSVEHELVKVAPARRLSGVGKRGAKVGVRYDIKGAKNPTAIVRATGPMHLIERSTKAHTIPRSRGRGRLKVLRLPGDVFRRSVQHPGTRGRRPFGKGIERGRPLALKTLRAAQSDALKRGFR
jgi:hypothetical protein